MLNLDLMTLTAALGGYNITNSDSQSVANKTRAQLRVNTVKAYVTGMFGGHWPKNWREGYLGLAALYTTGTVTVTNGSQTVTGSGTAWTSAMQGRVILLGVEVYRIATVSSPTQLYISALFQGSSSSGTTYSIWQDSYRLYPDVFAVDDFINFVDPDQMSESWPGNIRKSFPSPLTTSVPRLWTQAGNVKLATNYSTGTLSGSVNSNILTGNGTAWLANVEPGWDIKISSVTYRVNTVDSDTQISLYQMLSAAASASTYTAYGRNSMQVRFAVPTSQQLVSYSYFAKDWPFVNDSDSDWISEQYPEVIMSGVTWLDFLDKNDTVRAREAHLSFSDAIRDVHTAEHMNYTGVRTIGYNIPLEARDK